MGEKLSKDAISRAVYKNKNYSTPLAYISNDLRILMLMPPALVNTAWACPPLAREPVFSAQGLLRVGSCQRGGRGILPSLPLRS